MSNVQHTKKFWENYIAHTDSGWQQADEITGIIPEPERSAFAGTPINQQPNNFPYNNPTDKVTVPTDYVGFLEKENATLKATLKLSYSFNDYLLKKIEFLMKKDV